LKKLFHIYVNGTEGGRRTAAMLLKFAQGNSNCKFLNSFLTFSALSGNVYNLKIKQNTKKFA
jgi:hypothetical protein